MLYHVKQIVYGVIIVLNSTKHKHISTDTTVMMRGLNLTIKHYMVTKNHIATHTVLFKA